MSKGNIITIELYDTFDDIKFSRDTFSVNIRFYGKFSHEQVANRQMYTARRGTNGINHYLAFTYDSAFIKVVDIIKNKHPEYIIECDISYNGKTTHGVVYGHTLHDEHEWPNGAVIIALDENI